MNTTTKDAKKAGKARKMTPLVAVIVGIGALAVIGGGTVLTVQLLKPDTLTCKDKDSTDANSRKTVIEFKDKTIDKISQIESNKESFDSADEAKEEFLESKEATKKHEGEDYGSYKNIKTVVDSDSKYEATADYAYGGGTARLTSVLDGSDITLHTEITWAKGSDYFKNLPKELQNADKDATAEYLEDVEDYICEK